MASCAGSGARSKQSYELAGPLTSTVTIECALMCGVTHSCEYFVRCVETGS